MAPDDCKLDKLAQLNSVVSLVDGLGEKPDPQALAEDCPRLDDEPSLRRMAANEQQRTVELKRLIVNGQHKVNKYGACEGTAVHPEALSQSRLAPTSRPRTLSAYLVGKNWPNFGGESQGKKTQTEVEGDGDDGDDSRTGNCQPEKTRLERVAKHIPGLGIMMSLCASLFLGTAGMLVKLTTSVHGIEVAVMRAAIQLVIYAAIIGARGIRWVPSRREFWPVALRAGLGGMSITLSYSALKMIPLGDATTIRFSLPIWTLIMSYFFLRESCGSFKIFAVVISISGVVLVTKPDMCVMLFHRLLNHLHLESCAELSAHELAYERTRVEELAFLLEAPLSGDDSMVGPAHPLVSVKASPTELTNSTVQIAVRNSTSGGDLLMQWETSPPPSPLTYSTNTVRQFEGCLMALGSSICLSISIIALRLCKRTPSEVSIFWLSTLSIVIGTITLLAMDEWSVPNNWRDVSYILLNGVCGALGQWFMTNALKVEQSGVIALARTFDIEIAFLYSAFLLGEEIRITSIFGSVLVSLGVVSVVVPKWLGCGERDTSVGEQQSEVAVTNDTDSSASSLSSTAVYDNQFTNLTTTTTTNMDGTGITNSRQR